jgi:hypothetical protein
MRTKRHIMEVLDYAPNALKVLLLAPGEDVPTRQSQGIKLVYKLDQSEHEIFLAVSLQNPRIKKSDVEPALSEGIGRWVDTTHPNTRAAQDLLIAYPDALKVERGPAGPKIDLVDERFKRLSPEEDRQYIASLLLDPNIVKYAIVRGEKFNFGLHADGVPKKSGKKELQINAPEVRPYLPPNWEKELALIEAGHRPHIE